MAYKLSTEIQTLLDEYRALREEMESHEAALSRLQSRQYAIKGEIAALEIPPLKAEMEANNEKIAHLEERKRYYETDLKIREAQRKELKLRAANLDPEIIRTIRYRVEKVMEAGGIPEKKESVRGRLEQLKAEGDKEKQERQIQGNRVLK